MEITDVQRAFLSRAATPRRHTIPNDRSNAAYIAAELADLKLVEIRFRGSKMSCRTTEAGLELVGVPYEDTSGGTGFIVRTTATIWIDSEGRRWRKSKPRRGVLIRPERADAPTLTRASIRRLVTSVTMGAVDG